MRNFWDIHEPVYCGDIASETPAQAPYVSYRLGFPGRIKAITGAVLVCTSAWRTVVCFGEDGRAAWQ